MDLERRGARVRGTVQGVGFRPYVYRHAVERGLTGWVANEGGDVVLEVQGAAAPVEELLRLLGAEQLALAVVERVDVLVLEVVAESGFVIAASAASAGTDVRVSADVSPCPQCLAEMASPQDRRFGYPFINCTDCGPRYTIVRGVPYDRAATTMAGFVMCPACQREYDDPTDRRFHAQPNACAQCGPALSWTEQAGSLHAGQALAAAVACLQAGGVVAIKGVGGYHLACDATDEGAVRRLRAAKHRPHKPLAVMVADVETARRLCDLGPAALGQLVSPRRPIVLAPRRPVDPLATSVAPGRGELGLMLASTPLHALLLAALDRPLVMTSGNVSSEPMCVDDDEARALLGPGADGVLSHDRDIHVRADDSVVRSAPGERVQVLRRARGWVPQPTPMPIEAPCPILAVGAQSKSTVALAHRGALVLSQDLGDLRSWRAFQAFTSTIEHLEVLSGLRAEVIAHDLHPDYRSTAWAREQGRRLVGVQHHHAHVASCLLEHGRRDPVIGVVFDGVGLGTDGSLWGGEVMLADLAGFTRVGHLGTAGLPGGDAAVQEPWRMALSWLHRAVGEDAARAFGSTLDPRWAQVLSVVRSGRALETSSAGRLFDTVAALLGFHVGVSYEGQAAAELEAMASRAGGPRVPEYACVVSEQVLDPAPLLIGVVADLRQGVPRESIALGFHRWLASGSAEMALHAASEHAVGVVVLTGGVFQNVLLTDLLAGRLRRDGLEVLLHEQLPCNDGAISSGQAAVAAAVLA